MFEREAQKQFGAWLRHIRELRGLRRPQVAAALGYTNISKGCSRLAGWERGDAHPDTHFHAPLQAVLQVTPDEWRDRLSERDRQSQHAEPFKRAMQTHHQQVRQDLACHSDLLLASLSEIAAVPHWRDIHLPGLHFGIMYVGGIQVVHLGDLLSSWAAGSLQLEDHSGQAVWLFSGGASPLSGRHSVGGFYRNTRECDVFTSGLRGSMGRVFVDIIRRSRTAQHDRSPWNLAQLLAQLGVPVEPAILSSHAGAVGRYDFATATLHWRGEAVRFPLLRADAASSRGWEALRDTPVPPWEVKSADGIWTLQLGHLRDPQGYPQVRWSRPIPPLVQVWLAHHLTDAPLPRPGRSS